MKRYALCKVMMSLLMLAVCILPGQAANAALYSGGTGSDGPFEPTPTENTVLQIPESGVFNFTTINIPSGVTVTFKKNSNNANTPVIMLATGDVTINGTLNLNGGNASSTLPGEGGPGGYNGGAGGAFFQAGARGGGPGGGGGSANVNVENYSSGGGGAGYGIAGGDGANGGYGGVGSAGASYGNDRILPIIGGSGGGGSGGSTSRLGGGGGGGGGALVIVSLRTINVDGSITANGGNGALGSDTWAGSGGGGSGGSIRLVANTISGSGSIKAVKGNSGGGNIRGADGGYGRIRFEAATVNMGQTDPPYTWGIPYGALPQDIPALSITSIGGISVPAVTTGSYSSPDILLPYNTPSQVVVVVTGTNIPLSTTVNLKASPTVGNATTASGALTGTTDASSSASIPLTITRAYPSLITASVTLTLASLGMGPIYAQGEPVEKVRIETSMSGGSTMTYITASGKEIPADRLRS